MMTSKIPPHITREDRWDILDKLTALILLDFGAKSAGEQFNPLDPGDMARHGLAEIAAAYIQFMDVDEAADQILSDYQGGDPDIENIVPLVDS